MGGGFQFFDGSSSASPLLGEECGSVYQTLGVISTGNHLTLQVEATRTYKLFATYYVSEVGEKIFVAYLF